MYIKLVERYSQRSNWRGYTYIDEMRGQALLQLTQIGLQFNEAKSDNPFAYYTLAVNNSFTRVLNTEKKNQGIRDDLLEKSGQMPSWTRQLEHEMKSQERWQKVIKTRITDDQIPTETIKEIYAIMTNLFKKASGLLISIMECVTTQDNTMKIVMNSLIGL